MTQNAMVAESEMFNCILLRSEEESKISASMMSSAMFRPVVGHRRGWRFLCDYVEADSTWIPSCTRSVEVLLLVI